MLGGSEDPDAAGAVLDDSKDVNVRAVAQVGGPYRRYQRTATAITSRGNRKPANTEDEPDDVTESVSRPPRSTNAAEPQIAVLLSWLGGSGKPSSLS